MAVVAPVSAPTWNDAGLAAASLIAAGVEEVLLFGSVARGTADVHSDIDLVAMFADVDYSQRHIRRRELEAAARQVVSWPVQVHVTDRPEWRARVERVSTSFERQIAAETVIVAVGPRKAPVNWGKEMVLAMSDPQEALRHFDEWVLPELARVDTATRAGLDESNLTLEPEEREGDRLDRMVNLCSASAMTAETSLKALAVLYRVPAPSIKDLKGASHNMAACLDLVPPSERAAPAAVFDRLGIDLAVLSDWRWRVDYPVNRAVLRDDADVLAEPYAAMAADIVDVLADHLRRQIDAGDAVLIGAEGRRSRFVARIGAHDVRRGIPAQDIRRGMPAGPDLVV